MTTRFTLGGGPLLLTVGAAYDRQDQKRKGFVNNNGALGALRRDEDDTVHDQVTTSVALAPRGRALQ